MEVKSIVANLYTVEIGSLEHCRLQASQISLKAAPLVTKEMVRKIMDEASSKVIGASLSHF